MNALIARAEALPGVAVLPSPSSPYRTYCVMIQALVAELKKVSP